MKNTRIRIGIFIFAVFIVLLSLLFSNIVVAHLAKEERRQMQVWAEATRLLLNESYSDFVFNIVEQNNNIPVMIVDSNDVCLNYRNFNVIGSDTLDYFSKKLSYLKGKNPPIEIDIDSHEKQYIYYDDSILLKQLSFFPYIQILLVLFLIVVSYWAIISDKRSEQNKVWVGLSKETAHQLGTPITSLLAWVEILKSRYVNDTTIDEMSKDVERLRIVAERFSKIGSKPELQPTDLMSEVRMMMHYMQSRTSHRISYTLESSYTLIPVMLNKPLFEWVLENLFKNAIDAMVGEGAITVEVHCDDKRVFLDVSDTGKGIERKQFRAIFKPGYTTKKRGWGLGLSLVKRIVESYHKGVIFVKNSEMNKGTTFRIVLPLAPNSECES